MNIVFLIKSMGMGGVAVVTGILANKFVAEGHNVTICAFTSYKDEYIDKIDHRVAIHKLHGWKYSCRNIDTLRRIFADMPIDVVINQFGLSFVPILSARKALGRRRANAIKWYCVYHNTPEMNGMIQHADRQIEAARNPLKRSLLRLKRWGLRHFTAASMRWNYRHVDRYLLLSPSFIPKFSRFTGIRNPRKVAVMTNPLTIEPEPFSFDAAAKQREIIYVGRLDPYQKRVHRIIETWALLEERYPDWRVSIVGGGPELPTLQKLVENHNLKHVFFEGFQDPAKYYRRASILLLTSQYEGFPLVLAEAMNFGVVPVIYGSYSAVYDIIEDGIDGKIVAPRGGRFDPDDMAQGLAEVMADDKKRTLMAQNAIKKSEDYSIDNIYANWSVILNER